MGQEKGEEEGEKEGGEEREEVEEEWRAHTKVQDRLWRGGNMRVETQM